MSSRVLALIALVSVLTIVSIFGSGVRLTTLEAKQKAEVEHSRFVQIQDDNKQLREDLRELKVRHEQLIEYLEDMDPNIDTDGGIFSSPGLIRIPGSNSGVVSRDTNGSSERSDTRIIKRNNVTNSTPSTPDSDGNNDESGDKNSNGSQSIIEAPAVKVPEVKMPDVEKAVKDVTKGTPLEGLL